MNRGKKESSSPVIVPYPAIHKHGVIGDRRTAALIAADGTLDWMCLPDYSGDILFGALLDAQQGGHWKVGPRLRLLGTQTYLKECAILTTKWELPGAEAELVDFMPWPESDRPHDVATLHVVARRLTIGGSALECICDFAPRRNFHDEVRQCAVAKGGFELMFGKTALFFWTDAPMEAGDLEFIAEPGRSYWFVLETDRHAEWNAEKLEKLLEQTREYWRTWAEKLSYDGPKNPEISRTAQTIHLLSYAPCGSIVAAPTTSLPEQIGGDWNADYRFAWVRDASLSMAMLVTLGNKDDTKAYMKWLTTVHTTGQSPLQVLYGIHGETEVGQRNLEGVSGYRHSAPVRIGNRAYSQLQLDSLGYLIDCAWVYLQAGGEWDAGFWELIRHAADYTAQNWTRDDHSIWELPAKAQYVSSKVMSWTVLDRAIKISEKLRNQHDTQGWQDARKAIFDDVLKRGWSEKIGAFRQRYEADSLDAASLLIPITGFLPVDHPRVQSTIKQVAKHLTVDEFTYRFDPEQTPELKPYPLGEFEAAFLPCTFWLATCYALSGSPDAAERIIKRAEAISGETHLFGEAVDPRTNTFLGNFPLLFSQLEYARALLEIAAARKKVAAGR